MPQQPTPTPDEAPPVVDPQDNAAKMSAVNELLGITAEPGAKPEKVAPAPDTDKTVSERLAEAEKPPDSTERLVTVKPPKTLAELAERLEVKVEDLYSIEIPAAEDGGENPTIGTLKDEAAKQVDFAGRELEFEERRVTFGNDQAQARQELELVLKSLPEGAIKPEVMATARKERGIMLDMEAARALDVIPEWKDEDAKRADLASIGEHMEQYGFDKSHIDQIADHRMLRYMRDNLNRRNLVDKALAGVKPVKPVPKGKSAVPAGPKPKLNVTPQSSQSEQLDAIDGLLNPE